MIGMSPYEFEKRVQQQVSINRRQIRDAWMFTGVRNKSWRQSLAAIFAPQPKQILQRKAYHVLEDLLKHEKAEIRLRAAEIIVGLRQGYKAHSFPISVTEGAGEYFFIPRH